MSLRKPYVPTQPATWWLKNAAYRRYMLREGTSVFVLLYTVSLVCGLAALSRGEAAFSAWVDWQTTPLGLIFNLLTLAALLLHALTWFQLTPRMLPVRLGGFTPTSGQMVLGQIFFALGCWAILVGLGVYALVGASA